MANKSILKAIGPGLLWAGAAIGVSHIVQSTTAGANFGFELVWIIVLANILKYPFFEFAPRYASSTGETLIDGYSRLGKWAVTLYAIITISTMFFLMTAVTVVTAGLFKNIFNSEMSIVWWSVIIIIVLAGIIVLKKYSIIDSIVKFIIVLLAIAVIIAVISAFNKGYNPNPEYLTHFDFKNGSNIVFLLALIGWMPTAIDVSVWHSVWTIAKKKETGYAPSLKEALLDFKIGYIGTVILSLAFLSLGAIIMYGTGETFSSKGVEFAGQLLRLFTETLGSGAYIVIAVAALATMVSTTLTCLDAYPRVLEPTTNILFPNVIKDKSSNKLHSFWLVVVSLGSILIFIFFLENMKTMVTIATVISFLVAPVLGWLNLKVVTSKHVPKEARPNTF
ncbi:MAG: divalent metal cation transporter, partial [Chlorobi bacterium]|nr:divalent metal cation transporter [Chlorobiota bacterium]